MKQQSKNWYEIEFTLFSSSLFSMIKIRIDTEIIQELQFFHICLLAWFPFGDTSNINTAKYKIGGYNMWKV